MPATSALLAAVLAASGATIEVQPGDTLSHIAARHGVTVGALAQANGLGDPDRILAGQRLTVPTPAGPTGGAGVAGATARAEVGVLIERTARAYGWSPAFVKALAWQESGWQQHVTSSAGAVGIMQVLPETGAFVSLRVGRTLDLHDPADNVEAGVAFLDYLYGITGRNAELTLAGYYQGLASVRRNGVFPSTERFVANVLALRERFR